MTHPFSSVTLREIAGKVGTPVYVYSAKDIADRIRQLQRSLASLRALVCYALKANANMALLKIVARQGCGADVVSGGELFMARKVGIPPKRIVFAGVGKSREEIREGLRVGILMFNVESLAEAQAISQVARSLGKIAEVAVRINPDVEPGTHHHISTGNKETKFGIAWRDSRRVIQAIQSLSAVKVMGLHMHIGSQIVSARPFQQAFKKMLLLKDQLAREGMVIRRLDLGGGLGIRYRAETPQTAAEYASWLVPLLKPHGLEIIVEPGRFIMGNAGVLITKVLYRKQSPHKRFLIVDAGMNDLIRPSLYDAYHEIVPLRSLNRHSSLVTRQSEVVDVVGPVCETGDFFAKGRRLPRVEQGEYLAVMSAGAYGYVMSSNYNMRPRPAEVLVEASPEPFDPAQDKLRRRGQKWRVIRKRETYQDLLRGQRF